MNFFVIFLIFILNAGGIGLVYLMVKEKTQMQRIVYVAASFTIMYLISMIVYVIAGIGMENINKSYYRTNMVLLIAPINMLATVPLLIKSYKDMKKKKINFNKFSNTVTVSLVVLLVLCVCEVFAIKLFLKHNNSEAKTNDVIIKENRFNAGDILTEELINELENSTDINTISNSNSQEINDLSNETNNIDTNDENVESSENNVLSNSLNTEDSIISNSENSVVSNVETNSNGIGLVVN